MANDHYIPRFLTQPWEVQGGKLDRWFWVFDFDSQRFEPSPSKTHFAQDGLNPPDVEGLYGQLIESPVGHLRSEIQRRIDAGGVLAKLSPVERRALFLLCLMSGYRIAAAREGLPPDPMVTKPNLDIAALWMEARTTMFFCKFSERNALFFSESCYVPLPVAGCPPVLLIPVSTTHAFGFFETKFARICKRALGELVGLAPAFSVGVGRNVRSVLVPPNFHPEAEQQNEALKEHINKSRSLCRTLFDGVGLASEITGLPVWSWT